MEIEIPKSGIVVDAFCSGNPGFGGYRGIDLETKEVLFKRTYTYCTNNLVEFLAICHALMYVKKKFTDHSIIYSDSVVAIEWFNKQKVNSNIDTQKGKEVLFDCNHCEKWLSEQKRFTSVIKWETKIWGENPADFGNKK